MITRISDQPLDLLFHVKHVASARSGAVATFVGLVRDHDPSVVGEVIGLEYSAHPDAEAVLRRIAEDVASDEDVLEVAVSHRIGHLRVGDEAIVVAVAAAHRAEAFDACRRLVETVKAELPVWKREVLADGTHHWVGL